MFPPTIGFPAVVAEPPPHPSSPPLRSTASGEINWNRRFYLTARVDRAQLYSTVLGYGDDAATTSTLCILLYPGDIKTTNKKCCAAKWGSEYWVIRRKLLHRRLSLVHRLLLAVQSVFTFSSFCICFPFNANCNSGDLFSLCHYCPCLY